MVKIYAAVKGEKQDRKLQQKLGYILNKAGVALNSCNKCTV